MTAHSGPREQRIPRTGRQQLRQREEKRPKAAGRLHGRRSLAFAKALLQMPTIIADNGGYDAAELVTQLRAAHASGKKSFGLNMTNGTIADMGDLGIMESHKSKLQVVTSAAEAAEMILRVDDIIKSAPRQREQGYPGM